ncbi:uncharacterized protein LOC131048186 isoform X2 [Cryptomeria japonica]|uniref:uncharacterized protein LOC131048186 isoform X2 n=1 Tax=Cryptomeria japonica TaxID=3369 RepID=UPI0027DAAC03|nr:uncharacterized protein LOC131048186 isoform X2 [Cryptomeria japonica]
MATGEHPSFIYDTLLPLLGQDDLSYESPSGEILLEEAPDISPNTKFSNRKIKTKNSTPAMGTDEELQFLKTTRVSSPEPWLERGLTVLRREIGDAEDAMCKESSDGEIEYLSLEVSCSNLPEDPSAEPVTPVMVSQVEDKLKAVIEFPWSDSHKKITSPLLLLHQEIIDFCHFLSPTPEEQAARLAAIGRVSDVVKSIWPNCEVKIFGSFETGLYLPISDIDVVILNSNIQVPQNGLQALAKALSKKSIATKMQVIGKARVPIVKFIEKESNVAFDISFDVQNGPEAAKFIKDAISKIPPLRPLCLILKIFLQQRELNEVYSGGIGSYALLVMLITHLQVHWSRQCSTGRSILERNLGILLIDFFELYGRKLNAHDVGVSCRFGGQFFRKSLRGFLNPKRPHLLSVEDPQAPENDIGKNSYNILQVRAAFVMAFRKLTDTYIDDLISSQNSILGRIIKIDAKLLERVGRLTKSPQLDAFLATASDHALRYKSNSDADETALHPVMKNQGSLLNRWQLCDDEPLPRGPPSAKSGLKRKWKEEKQFAKRFKRKNDKNVSPSVKKQEIHFTTQHSKGRKSKKRKHVSGDEDNSPTRHGSRYKKSKISSVKVEHKHLRSGNNNNFGARTSNYHAAKFKYS